MVRSGVEIDTSGNPDPNDYPTIVVLMYNLVFAARTSKTMCFMVAGDSWHESVSFGTLSGSRRHPGVIFGTSGELRYETTRIRLEHLREAMPLKQAQRKIQDLLCNGEPIWKIRSKDTKARILIGHGLDHDLDCLKVEYPAFLIRHEIQNGIQDPYDDCVATLRLYTQMRDVIWAVPGWHDPHFSGHFGPRVGPARPGY
uniref:Exonuclease domain-containing protein n=1 Tax=Ananas comosus var. bracteatus TaxID=296719 RepID=A0A6V7NEY7_ANACO|nr:unnamed protein product [Ananas comosus var. bracteatus]